MSKLVIKAIKYRIKDESANAEFLQYIAAAYGQTRFVYNQLHDYIDKKLEQGQRMPSCYELNNNVNRVLKKQYEWMLGTVDKFYFTHAVNKIHTAYQGYLKGSSGKLKFRRKYAPKQTVTTNFTNNNIKVILHRPIECRILGA